MAIFTSFLYVHQAGYLSSCGNLWNLNRSFCAELSEVGIPRFAELVSPAAGWGSLICRMRLVSVSIDSLLVRLVIASTCFCRFGRHTAGCVSWMVPNHPPGGSQTSSSDGARKRYVATLTNGIIPTWLYSWFIPKIKGLNFRADEACSSVIVSSKSSRSSSRRRSSWSRSCFYFMISIIIANMVWCWKLHFFCVHQCLKSLTHRRLQNLGRCYPRKC